MAPLAFIGNLGPFEMMLVAGIALLLFGKNLPKVARDAGKAIVEFKKGMSGIDAPVNEYSYNSTTESSNATRPAAADDRVEATAPKFEPPKSEPTAAEATPSQSVTA